MSSNSKRARERIRHQKWRIVREDELLRMRLDTEMHRLVFAVGIAEGTALFLSRLFRRRRK